MAVARAGVVTAVEVNGPLNSSGSAGPMFDFGNGSTWALLWFIFAVIILFVIL